jgi:hypothetical protein
MNDPINPNHYKQGGIESIDAIKAFMSEEAFKGFLKGNCQKYLFRYEKKNGIEDLRKCQWYLERLIGVLEEEQKKVDSALLQTRQGPSIPLSHEVGNIGKINIPYNMNQSVICN